MQNKYVAGSMLAVLLTAMVLGSAVAGLSASSHFLASAGPKRPILEGVGPLSLPSGGLSTHNEQTSTTGNLDVSVVWCSDWTATYCVPIGGATVAVSDQSGAVIASALTNTNGNAVFSVNTPATYTVTADIENVSAFGYMAGAEYQTVQASAGTSTVAQFQYIQTVPQDS